MPRGGGVNAGDDAPRVVVVGAGLAGLRCAEFLHRSGVHVELYEATERVGGRCWSAFGLADGIVAEHGGELIAPAHRHVIALAEELGLELEDRMAATEPDRRAGAVVFEGRRVGPGEGTDEVAAALESLAGEAARVGELRYDRAGDEARRLDERSAREWLDQHVAGGAGSLAGRMLDVSAATAYGVPTERLSALALVYQFAVDPAMAPDLPGTEADGARGGLGSLGEILSEGVLQLHVRGGNDLLAQGLARRLPEEALVLGSPLTAVRVQGDGVALRFGGGPDVLTEAVVLALPLPPLRRVDLDGANLSDRRRRAIDELPMGRNTKLLLGLDRAPASLPSWPGYLLDLDDPPLAIWDTTPAQGGTGGVLTVFTVEEVFEAAGAHAAPAPEILARALERLERLVPGLRDAFTGRAWLDAWPQDPWSGGSYLAFGPGQYTRYWGLLGEAEGPIHFAGEHTSTSGQGYLDGAIESGERAAREVLASLGLPAGRGRRGSRMARP